MDRELEFSWTLTQMKSPLHAAEEAAADADDLSMKKLRPERGGLNLFPANTISRVTPQFAKFSRSMPPSLTRIARPLPS
jgi:hypothetical protein